MAYVERQSVEIYTNPKTDKMEKDQKIYESFQATVGTLMTVSTLLMGFTITGSLISLSYAADNTYSQQDIVEFVGSAMLAFVYATASLSLTLILSVIASQIHAGNPEEDADKLAWPKLRTPCAPCVKASAFFQAFSFVLLIAEVFIYACAFQTMCFMWNFTSIVYIKPSESLCPGTYGDEKKSVDSFCGAVGFDFYTEAKTNFCGGVLQPNAPRAFDLTGKSGSQTRNTTICNQLDLQEKDNGDAGTYEAGLYFGWEVYGPGLASPVTAMQVVQNNGKFLGESMCYKSKAQATMTSACTTSSSTYKVADCIAARSDYRAADACAGQKYNDLMQCYHTCFWFGTENAKWQPLTQRYGFILNLIELVKGGIHVWIGIRVVLWVVLAVKNCWLHYCALDQDEDEYDDGC